MIKRRFAVLAILLAFVLAACSSLIPSQPGLQPSDGGANGEQGGTVQDAPDAQARDAGGEEVPAEATAAPVGPTVIAATDTAVPTDAPISEEPKGEACPYQASLKATEPGSVELASGGIQLVEFFAFW